MEIDVDESKIEEIGNGNNNNNNINDDDEDESENDNDGNKESSPFVAPKVESEMETEDYETDEGDSVPPLFEEVNISKSRMKSEHFDSLQPKEPSRKKSVQEQIGTMRYVYEVDEASGESTLLRRKS